MKQVYYFSAPWCVPCQSFGPTMDKVSEQISVNKVNVDYEPNVITKFGVRNVPTVILVENGQEVRRFSGVKSYNEVINFING
jgi:thioredoxin-like negative regulator of GroEL